MFVYRQRTFSKIVIFSIILAIIIGTALLKLPISQNIPVPLLDCLFTATSSISVTGILTVPFDSFTLFGKIIIALLIQIGGIGLVTLYLFLFTLFSSKLAITTKIMVGQIFELESLKNIKQVLSFIILFTLTLESIGALIIYFIISSNYSTKEAIFHSIFHSISSFCSAGLSSFENNMINFQQNIPMLLITGILILSGTLGFIMWYELFLYIKNRINHKRLSLSLTTKVILSTTTALILVATLLLIMLESYNFFDFKSFGITLLNMLFNAISYRSTGFTTINLEHAQIATIFLILIYGFIGSSPGSTGGGIKVTTFAIFIATIRSVIKSRTSIELKMRKIPQDEIFKALAILSLSFSWIIFCTFILLLTEKDKNFSQLFFETLSTFATLGVATDTTPQLSIYGKLIVIANMIVGRIGTLTILLAFEKGNEKPELKYPEERITIN
ncbi:TrkH family potassium uptake protein [Candidatus Babela massiliensis]|uniref:Trk-type K+ transport system membrane component n=1 Tax=Candidatus Babela massiliensis TaxID=673862 RepID=V6DFE6_9BACT|nr:potassium transporter TrkG [Candidatus Babela massiliensis]CDK30274.1 Trk-type K+ transport system membrane component [Candidatus Babela massiliensis]